MKITKRPVTETKTFIEVDSHEFLLSHFLDTLDKLEDADGLISRLVIYDGKLAKFLEDKGVAFRNARGSYGRTTSFKDFYEKVYAFLEKEWK